jgi:hypothetical protein
MVIMSPPTSPLASLFLFSLSHNPKFFLCNNYVISVRIGLFFCYVFCFVLGRIFLSVSRFYVCFFFLLSLLCFSQASAFLLEEALSQLEQKKAELDKMAEQLRLADRCTPPIPIQNIRNLTPLTLSLPSVVLRP